MNIETKMDPLAASFAAMEEAPHEDAASEEEAAPEAEDQSAVDKVAEHIAAVKRWMDAHTVASGLRVPAAVGDFLMLDAIRQSGGTAVTVSDDELLAGVRELACEQGIYACPEAGAVWKAAEKLRQSGWLDPDARIVLFNTGSGLKYNHLFPPGDLPRLDFRDPHALDSLG